MGKLVFESQKKIFRVEYEETQIRGKAKTIEKIITSDAVIVVPFLDKETVILERSLRPVIGKEIYELPAGMLDKEGEDPRTTAARELEEELGYRAERVEPMFSGYSSPGRMTEKVHFFKATGLKKTEARLGGFEVIEPVPIKLEKALEMVGHNEIEDVHTIAALLFCSTFRN